MSNRPARVISRRSLLFAPVAAALAADARRVAALGPLEAGAADAAAAAIAADPRLLAVWRCGASECPGYTYDPLFGEPLHDVAAGTAFEDLPWDFFCPACGAGLMEFVQQRPRTPGKAIADAVAGSPQW